MIGKWSEMIRYERNWWENGRKCLENIRYGAALYRIASPAQYKIASPISRDHACQMTSTINNIQINIFHIIINDFISVQFNWNI